MSDNEEDLLTDWIPYSQRSDWADIKPIPQDDGVHPVVAVLYSSKFQEVFGYFRAIVARKEHSVRAMDLTTDALNLNPANYTVWQYRRDLLKSLNVDLHAELEFVGNMILENPKNYQVWHHRRVIVELLNDGSNELSLTERALCNDSKNYHAWQHRQWALRTFNLFEGELEFIDRLIQEDIRNNSAWNQRFFVVKKMGFTPQVIADECRYALKCINKAKRNESAWNYLKGVLRQSVDTAALSGNPEVVEFCENLYQNECRSPHLLTFLVDLYTEKCIRGGITREERIAYIDKVYSMCQDLAIKYDIIRQKYWLYVGDQLKTQFSEELGGGPP